ncbi:PAS domain-containing protein, partial [Bradyrhizobium sp.]|uniref:PAS domain-containing protein n=1 Tax=Bradyrhizobium sp. TaxID=376 RepID=UPI003C3F27FA
MTTPASRWRLKSPVILNYGIAAVSAAAAVAVNLAGERLGDIDSSVSFLLCAIMFVAWACGPGPALLASAITLLAFEYFLLQPAYSFALELKEIPPLVLFAAAALFVVWLSAAQRRSQASLRRARDELRDAVQKLQELNETLRVGNGERRQAEERARLAEQELQATIDTVPVLMLRHRADGVIDFVNQIGRSYSGLISTNWTSPTNAAAHPDDVPRLEAAWNAALATGEPFETEQRLRRADGEYRWFVTRRVPLRNRDGEVIAWYGAAHDIEDRKRAEDALRTSEAELAAAKRELQLMIDSIPVMVSTFEPDGTRSYVNQQWQNYTGHHHLEATGKGLNTSVYYHPDDVERFDDAWRVALATGETMSVDVRTRRADGAYRWYTMRRAPRRDENGEIVKWYSVGIDIEEQKVAETAVRRSEARLANAERELRLTLDSIPTLVWRARTDGSAEFLNKRWLDYTGFSLQQALGWEWAAAIHPDDRGYLQDAWLEMLTSGEADEVEARIRRFDGSYRWFLFRTEALRDAAGTVVGWYGTNTDIEDRKQAESALQRSEAYSAEAQKLSQTGSLAWDMVGDTHFWSDQTYQIMGFDRSVTPSLDLIAQRVHPDDRPHLLHEAHRAEHGAQQFDYEQRLLMPDGQIKYLHVRARRVRYNSGKEEIVGALMDITAAKKSQEALGSAQAALAHASRVSTLGEISATIAHEVNQPLAAIVANGQACLRFLRRETPDLDDVRGAVEWIVKDGNRAGEIIRRVRALLKKVDSERLPLDINDVIHEVA